MRGGQEGAALDLCSFLWGSGWARVSGDRPRPESLPGLALLGAGPAVSLSDPLSSLGRNCLCFAERLQGAEIQGSQVAQKDFELL